MYEDGGLEEGVIECSVDGSVSDSKAISKRRSDRHAIYTSDNQSIASSKYQARVIVEPEPVLCSCAQSGHFISERVTTRKT
jgi:hypothetical protein